MKVSAIMTTEITTASPETTLEEISTMMRDDDVGSIPIVDDEELVGIVTDRDIVVRCIAEGKDPVECTAEEVMSENIVSVEADEDVQRASQMMSQRQIRRLPVVEEGRLIGMVSLGDLAVKERDDSLSAEALEGVSEGVKTSRSSGRAQSGSRGGRSRNEDQGTARTRNAQSGASRSRISTIPMRESDGDEFASESEGREAETVTESRLQDRESRFAMQGRSRTSVAQNRRAPSRGAMSSRRGTPQGITNQDRDREAKRQERVAPARAKATARPKRKAS